MRINAKDSHIFPTKNNSVFVIFTLNILNDTSNLIDSIFAIFQKRLEQLNLTFHHRLRI